MRGRAVQVLCGRLLDYPSLVIKERITRHDGEIGGKMTRFTWSEDPHAAARYRGIEAYLLYAIRRTNSLTHELHQIQYHYPHYSVFTPISGPESPDEPPTPNVFAVDRLVIARAEKELRAFEKWARETYERIPEERRDSITHHMLDLRELDAAMAKAHLKDFITSSGSLRGGLMRANEMLDFAKGFINGTNKGYERGPQI
jgi:hypothetical protein